MSTLQPRPRYDDSQLAKLYPEQLQLQLVQVLLRHGERTPMSPRFQNAGLHVSWPYCQVAQRMRSAVLESDGSWSDLQWKQRLETLGANDSPTPSAGPKHELDGICMPGDLTDRGRETTLALGQRLRVLYIDQLGFLPRSLDEATKDTVSLRATPTQRALASVQQTFTGLYPPSTRTSVLSPPVVVQRASRDENLYPNDEFCARFAELSRAFGDRTARRWNDSPEMNYINKKIGKWMTSTSPTIKVDSHPRLTGIMDTINASLAHGPGTRLPGEFYDQRLRDNIDRICTEEWFVGYEESDEYRRLGIGSLVGDLTQRMVNHVRSLVRESGYKNDKISLAGCHDTTLAATLTALGGFRTDKDKWPPFTSSIAIELFGSKTDGNAPPSSTRPNAATWPIREKSWWYSLFSSPKPSTSVAREPLTSMPEAARKDLDGHYVRVRYNDVPVVFPFCRAPTNHYEDDESLCTLAAFKHAADSLTPGDWRSECNRNLGKSAFPATVGTPPAVSP